MVPGSCFVSCCLVETLVLGTYGSRGSGTLAPKLLADEVANAMPSAGHQATPTA